MKKQKQNLEKNLYYLTLETLDYFLERRNLFMNDSKSLASLCANPI